MGDSGEGPVKRGFVPLSRTALGNETHEGRRGAGSGQRQCGDSSDRGGAMLSPDGLAGHGDLHPLPRQRLQDEQDFSVQAQPLTCSHGATGTL